MNLKQCPLTINLSSLLLLVSDDPIGRFHTVKHESNKKLKNLLTLSKNNSFQFDKFLLLLVKRNENHRSLVWQIHTWKIVAKQIDNFHGSFIIKWANIVFNGSQLPMRLITATFNCDVRLHQNIFSFLWKFLLLF